MHSTLAGFACNRSEPPAYYKTGKYVLPRCYKRDSISLLCNLFICIYIWPFILAINRRIYFKTMLTSIYTTTTSLHNHNIACLWPFLAINHGKFYIKAGAKPFAVFLHWTKVNKNFFAVFAGDKAKALAATKPFDAAHFSTLTFASGGFCCSICAAVVRVVSWTVSWTVSCDVNTANQYANNSG